MSLHAIAPSRAIEEIFGEAPVLHGPVCVTHWVTRSVAGECYVCETARSV